jgi:outer membrane immunogenic protein
MKGVVMKGLLLAGIGAGLLVVGPALAADMAVKAPMMAPPPPAFSWTGCYIGAGFGYGMWNQETFRESDPGHLANSQTETGGGRGWLGTAQIGCDYQIGSNWVIGAQGDWDWDALKGSPNFANGLIGNGENNSWTWAAGGRVGYVPSGMPQLLAYLSAGYTQAHFDQVNLINFATGAPTNLFLAANTYTGWYLGSGYEYGLGFLPGLFWKTEYRFASFNAADLSHIQVATGLTNGEASNSKKFIQTLRSELVWRFNWFH